MKTVRSFFRKIRILLIILVVVVVGIWLFSLRQTSTENFEVYTVTKRDIVEEVTIAGSIDTVSRANLGFKTSGRIASIKVSEGDTVEKGQVIAALDSSELYADLANARADRSIVLANTNTTVSDLASAKKKLDETIEQQNTLVQNAYRNLLTNGLQAYSIDPEDEAIVPTITGTYTGLNQGEYIFDVYSSGSNLGFSYTLKGIEQGTYSAYDTPSVFGSFGLFATFTRGEKYADTEFIVPIPNVRSSSYQSVKNAYDAALQTRNVAITQAQEMYDSIAASEQFGANRSSKTAAQLQSANAKIASVEARIDDTVIRAPFSGVIARIDLEIGEVVSISEEPITLIAEGGYEMIVLVPEIDVAKIAINDVVDVILDARPDLTWMGVVRHIDIIDTQVDGVPVYETTVEVMNPTDVIRVGMNARARIETSRKNDVIAIPQYMIIKKDGESFIKKRTGEKVEIVRIETGAASSDGFIEVTNGIRKGDDIVREFE